MSETPDQRRERLLAVIQVALAPGGLERLPAEGMAPAVLDALLEGLEPPVASMVYGFRTLDPPPGALVRGFDRPTWYRPAVMMGETPEGRRERLLTTIRVVLRSSKIQGLPAERMAQAVLNTVLEALEAPLAAMVRLGVVQNGPGFHRLDDGTVSPFGFTLYRPAP